MARFCATLGACALIGLSGCRWVGESAGTSGTHDTVSVTPSISGNLAVVNGGSQVLSLSFSSSDAKTISRLTVTQGLTSMPSGWAGPAAFDCTTVSTGSGCTLNLTYAPTSVGGGALTIAFSYINNADEAQTGSVTVPYSSSSTNNIGASTAPSGQINAVVGGGSQTVEVTFTTDDGNPATELAVAIPALPPGWSTSTSAPSFACTTVSTGNGCQLSLLYAPLDAGRGTLTLSFTYTDNAGQAKTGTITVPYASTQQDNVVGTASPTGQINAIVGAGQQPVNVTFTTDDGNPATDLTVTTDLAALPIGWNSGSRGLSCATISTGNGCQLTLSYAPTAVGSGSVALQYNYLDNAGSPKNGILMIPYAATAHDNIVGTTSPSGQINAVLGSGSQAIAVSFTTDDGNVATGLTVTTPLNSLPSGWSSGVQNFACANVSVGNGCQLNLGYAPTADASSTLALHYEYADNSGRAKTGTVNIPYVATAHDNVVGAVSPTPPLSVLVNDQQTINVTFTTDDGNPATLFSVTSGLSSLPNGWSGGAGGLSCANVATGSGCQVSLTYAPTALASGTLSIGYTYTDNAGAIKTGTVSIPYSATVHDNVVGTASPTGTIRVPVNASQSISVPFTTDDGNPASSFSITTDLTTLPSGWTSAPTTLNCSSVSTGTGCELSLTYAPTAAATGTLTLNFGYTDNAGTPKTGTVSIPYVAPVLHAYLSDQYNGVYICTLNGTTGSLASCQTTGGGFTGAWSVAFFSGTTGNYAYVVNGARNGVYLCQVDSSGLLANNCASQGSNFYGPEHVTVSGSRLYVANQGYVSSNVVTVCSISSTDGTLSNCSVTAPGSGLHYASGVTLSGSFAYVSTDNAGLFLCAVDLAGGGLNNCATTGNGVGNAYSLSVSGGIAYIANHNSGFTTCTIGSDGTLSGCGSTQLGGFFPSATGVAINGGFAYVTVQGMFGGSSDLYVCAINGLTVASCTISNGSATFGRLFDVLIN